MLQRRSSLVASAVFLLALIFAGLPSFAAAPVYAAPPLADIPEITIKAHDYSYEGPDQIEAGLVAITLENDGSEAHQATLARLQDGKTLDDLTAAFQQDAGAGMAMLEFVGGPNTVAAGHSQRVIASVREGNYVVICFMTSPDGTPHLAKGMIKPLQVVARASQEPVAEPEVAATVTLKDFSFSMPAEVQTGRQLWKVTNDGPQPHELTLIKLAEGKTMDDVAGFFQQPSGPPPFEEAGGISGLSTGVSGWVELDLQPGNYVALCFIPDPTSGKAHADLGMVMPFTVVGGDAAPQTLPTTGGGSTSYGVWSTLLAGAALLGTAWIVRRKVSHS